MANIKPAMDVLGKLEFSRSSNVLHYNKGEKGYTFYGIYQYAHPRWEGWKTVYKTLRANNYNMSITSNELYLDLALEKEVIAFYGRNFWDVIHLDEVQSQKIANEIFIFGVNTNPRKAVKKAQKIIGVKVDGWVGAETLKALNNFNEKQFSIEFDLAEIAYYRYLAFSSSRKHQYKRFYNGWVNRARYV